MENNKADKFLKKELYENKIIDEEKITENIFSLKLKDIFKKKVDLFYDEIIEYSSKIKLTTKILSEIKLFDYYAKENNKKEIINDFSDLRIKLKKINSRFYANSALYNLYVNKSQINPYILADKILSNWEKNIITDIVNLRIKKIIAERDKIIKPFYNRLKIIKKKLKFLNMFPDYLDYFWDEDEKKAKKSNLKWISKYSNFIKKDPTIEKIAEELGRSLEQDNVSSKQLKKVDVEQDTIVRMNINSEEVVGLTEAAKIEHLLPSELVYLNNPKLKLIFYKKFAEHKLKNLEYEADDIEKQIIKEYQIKENLLFRVKGDVIICIDSSTSMSGPFEFIAKSLTLAILKNIVNVRNKTCILINFSYDNMFLNMNDVKKSPEALNFFLEQSFQGKTDLDAVLNKSFEFMDEYWQNNKYIDLLIISDFLAAPLDKKTVARMHQQQKYKNRIYGIEIGNRGNKKITRLFNNSYVYDPNDPFTSEKILNTLLEYNKNYNKNIEK